MTIQMNTTLRAMLVATVASSMLLTACSNDSSTLQQAKITGEARPPVNNPNAAGASAVNMAEMEGLHAPQENPQTTVGEDYPAVPQNQQPQVMPQQEEKPGLFSWMWSKPKQQVDTTQRRVPSLNQNAAEQVNPMATASYEAAAPVAVVDMAANAPAENGSEWTALQIDQNAAPQKDVIVAEEVVVMDEPYTPVNADAQPKTFPSLTSVPPRPERLNALNEKNARMADLEAARTESATQNQQLNKQMASDSGQSDLDAEFAALVASPETSSAPNAGTPMPQAMAQSEEIQVIQEEAPAVVVDQGSVQPWESPAQATYQPQQPATSVPTAPVEVANAAPQPMQTWEPVPMVEPQTAMVQQPMQPIQQDEWVSLQQDPAAQMAVPVEGVTVDGAPQVASVSAIPVVPEGGDIQLVPPSTFGATVRTLPESRYAARRQAVYMQRYARQPDQGY